MKIKRGNTAIVYPLLLGITLIIITVVSISIFNNALPFIYYQKLNTIVTKYMFVVEKFGYLTSSERQNMLNELASSGFSVDNITIECPSQKQSYGTLIEFKVKYKLYVDKFKLDGVKVTKEAKETLLTINKNSYSKI